MRSRSRSEMSRRWPMRLGSPLKNHTWLTGVASVMWPRRSRRTLACVTSTPHLSQITPRCFMRLYLPHRHSQSVIGPKIFAQNRPSRSGLNVRYLIVSGLVTSPCDHDMIFSGDARLMRIASKSLVSELRSWNEGLIWLSVLSFQLSVSVKPPALSHHTDD